MYSMVTTVNNTVLFIWKLLREAWCAVIHGVARSRSQLSNWTVQNWLNLILRKQTRFIKNKIVYVSFWIFYVLNHQFSSVTQSCPTLCDPMNRSMPGLPVHHQFLELTQPHVHWVSDAIQPSHPLSSPSPLALNLSQHHGTFKWVSSSQSIGVSALAPVLPMNIQVWSPLGWTGWISL